MSQFFDRQDLSEFSVHFPIPSSRYGPAPNNESSTSFFLQLCFAFQDCHMVKTVEIICSNTYVKNEIYGDGIDERDTNRLFQMISNFLPLNTTILHFKTIGLPLSHAPYIRQFTNGIYGNDSLEAITIHNAIFDNIPTGLFRQFIATVARHPTIIYLDISYCKLDRRQMRDVLQILISCRSRLTTFISRGNYLKENSYLIIRLLHNLPLQRLELVPAFSSFLPEKIPRLLREIGETKYLRELSLQGNFIIDKYFMAIAEFLASSECRLEYLCLARCYLNSLDVFCDYLPSMTSLRFIDLTGNPDLYEKGLQQFSRVVPFNDVLSWLYFDDFGSLNEDEVNKTIHHLDINNAGYRFAKDPTSIPLSLWPILLDRASNMDFKGYIDSTFFTEMFFFTTSRRLNVVYNLLQGLCAYHKFVSDPVNIKN